MNTCQNSLRPEEKATTEKLKALIPFSI